MAAKKTVTLQIQVEVDPESAEFLKKNSKGDEAATLSGWSSYWLQQQAKGGIMVTAEDHDYLAGLRDGKRFRNSREIVRAIEAALKREDSQYTQRVPIDPAWIGPLREAAEQMGWTPEQLLQDVINTALANGWAYSWTPQNFIQATDSDYARISAAIGKKVFFGADVADFLSGQAKKSAGSGE